MAMAFLAAILENRQNIAVEGDLLRQRRPGEQSGGNHPEDHCLYYKD